MFIELINKLKNKKQQLQEISSNNIVKEEQPIENEKIIDIILSKENKFYKIEINDYISIGDYVKKTKSSQEYSVLDLVSNSVLWNSEKQKVNKGIYYIIENDNQLYNILITDNILKIDERNNKEIDDEIQKDNIIEEKIITFNLENYEYRYCSFKHDKTGNTYYTKYYDENRNFSLGVLELSSEETYEEINQIIYNLERINEIDKILNIKLLKEYLLNNLEQKFPQRKRIL